MNTEIVKVISLVASANDLARAGELIREGKLVAFPTETVYGLGASAYDGEAAVSVFAAKGRPADNPLIVHVAEPADAEAFAETSELYYKLAERFMPGPLTVILPKKDAIPPEVTAGLDSVAVRCPSHPVAHALIRAAGVPIAAPSANKSGRPSPTTAAHVTHDMMGEIPMIIDGGDSDFGLESTVIKPDGDGCIILRPGAVTPEMLAECCRSVAIAEGVTDPAMVGDKPLSPGMKYKHYAPKAELILIDGDDEAFENYANAYSADGYAVLCSDEDADSFPDLIHLSVGKRGDTHEYCHRFFSLLRHADEIGARAIFAKLPSAEGEGLAIYNRIIRAAGCRVIKLK